MCVRWGTPNTVLGRHDRCLSEVSASARGPPTPTIRWPNFHTDPGSLCAPISSRPVNQFVFYIRRVPSICMSNVSIGAGNLYQRRLEKERAVPEEEVLARMRWDLPVLSANRKCSVSLDLPMTHCEPTPVCAEVCYAAQGQQFYRNSVVKALAIDRLIEREPEHVARKMIDEAAGRTIRIAGSGEILPMHAVLLAYVNRFRGKWWGFTRRVDTHRMIPALMFSIDATTDDSVMDYVERNVPVGRRSYLRRPKDPPASLPVAVTFPIHGSWTNYTAKTPRHATDCPADRKEVEGCWSCRRCY